MKSYFKNRKFNIIFSFFAIVAMWLVWIIAYYQVKNDYIVPSFWDTLKSLGGLFTETIFWTAFGNTLLRTVEAFAVSFVLAAALAVLSSYNKYVQAFINPVMVFLRTLPTLAVILILLIWTNPKVAPIIVAFLVVFPAVYAQIIAAMGDIDRDLVQMAKVYKIPKRDRLFKIYLPLVMPNILSQTGANISLGLKVMISAEVLASTSKSMGSLMYNARLVVEMPRLAALTLVAVFAGLIIDIVFTLLTRVVCKWKSGGGA